MTRQRETQERVSVRKLIHHALSTVFTNDVKSIYDLVDAVSLWYGKPIYVDALDEAGNWGALTAFLTEDEEAVTVYYRLSDSPQYRLQCICHELGHLVMRTECSLPFDDEVAAQVAVPAGVVRLQARDLRDSPSERSAEEFAFSAIRALRDSARPKTRDAEIWA